MADDFKVVFELDVSSAIASANQLSRTLGTTVASINSLGEAAGKSGLTQAATATTQATTGMAQSTRGLNTATRELHTSLPTLRYALYDVSNSLFAVGAAFGAISIAAIGAAVSWERSFANVIRTTGVTGTAVDDLREGIAALTREIPQSFGDLTEIAALGGQLGIEAEGIVDFTRVVAMLTTTTDLSAEAAGTALGRFKALMDVAPSEFEALASAILRTGINSVATETQIVNISTQISSMGDFAGLSAHEVVGLSAALASVGAQPELSRGTITRVFTQMSRAIAEGGARLESFADLAGVTGDEFAKAFGTGAFGGLFQTFLANISKEGGDAVQVLNDLGITSVRDVPLLLRLSNATETVTNAFSDAAIGWERATELQDNYGIVVQTTAERLNLLWNAVTELFATLGAGTTGPLAEFVTFLQEAINGLTDFLATDFGQRVGLLVLGITAFIAALALLGGAIARAGAGLAALRTVFLQVSAAAGGATTATGLAAGSMNVLGISAGRARIGVSLLATAFKALAAATIVLALPDIGNFAVDAVDKMRGLSHELDDVITRFNTPVDPNAFLGQRGVQGISALSEGVIAFGRGLGDIESTDFGDLKRIDEGLRDLADGGSLDLATKKLGVLREAWLEQGGSIEGFKAAFPDAITALEKGAQAAGYTTEQLEKLKEAERLAAEATQALADSLGLSEEGFTEYQKSVQSAAEGSINLGKAITSATKEGIFSLSTFNEALLAQVTALENWEVNLNTLLARGVDFSIVQELVSLGPEAGGQLAQSLVDNFGTTLGNNTLNLIQRGIDMEDALSAGFIQNQALIVAAAQKGDEAGAVMLKAITEGASQEKIAAIISKYKINVPIGANTNPATAQLRSWLAAANSGAYGIARIRVAGVNSVGGITRASGGPVYGPGTSTSDSIPARLSDGEYVIRASSVRKYGMGMFDALNRGVARFANGGPVGSRATSGGGSGSGIMELGPHSLNRLGGAPQVNVYLTDEAIARAANRGNKKIVASGGRP